jgi:hypothetical protein
VCDDANTILIWVNHERIVKEWIAKKTSKNVRIRITIGCYLMLRETTKAGVYIHTQGIFTIIYYKKRPEDCIWEIKSFTCEAIVC